MITQVDITNEETSDEENEWTSTNTKDINNPRFKDPVPQRTLTRRRTKNEKQQDDDKVMKLIRQTLAAKQKGQKLVAEQAVDELKVFYGVLYAIKKNK